MLKPVSHVKISGNRDTGSLPVSTEDLPPAFRQNGLVPTPGTLLVRQVGNKRARVVTWVMGSDTKGYNLCTRGAGPFPSDGEFEILVEDEIPEEGVGLRSEAISTPKEGAGQRLVESEHGSRRQ